LRSSSPETTCGRESHHGPALTVQSTRRFSPAANLPPGESPQTCTYCCVAEELESRGNMPPGSRRRLGVCTCCRGGKGSGGWGWGRVGDGESGREDGESLEIWYLHLQFCCRWSAPAQQPLAAEGYAIDLVLALALAGGHQPSSHLPLREPPYLHLLFFRCDRYTAELHSPRLVMILSG
jgi:hypothetical protein